MKKIVISAISLLLLFAVFFRAFRNYSRKQAELNRPIPERIVPVETAVPSPTSIVDRIRATGSIAAEAEVTVYSKVSGKILRNRVQLGSAVRPGQVVAEVDRDEVGYQYQPVEVTCSVKGVVSRVQQQPGAQINSSTPLLTLVDIDAVKAVAAVDELKIRFVKIGQEAGVRLEAYPGETFQARVARVSPVCNPVNRTVDIEVAIANGAHRLKPGMYAEVELVQGERRGLTVPVTAVLDRSGHRVVFCEEAGRAVMRAVTTGAMLGERIEVVSGLQGSERVIVAGNGSLKSGDKVKSVGEAGR